MDKLYNVMLFLTLEVIDWLYFLQIYDVLLNLPQYTYKIQHKIQNTLFTKYS